MLGNERLEFWGVCPVAACLLVFAVKGVICGLAVRVHMGGPVIKPALTIQPCAGMLDVLLVFALHRLGIGLNAIQEGLEVGLLQCCLECLFSLSLADLLGDK